MRQPGRLDNTSGDQVSVAVEDVALVEGWLAVGSRRVGDVAEGAPTGEQRGLPTMTPKAGQFPHALPPDTQTSAAERLLVVADLHRARRAEQLLVACATHQVALDRGLQPLPRLCGQGALHPRRHRHRGLDLEADVDQRPVLVARDQTLRGRLDRLALEGHRPGIERLYAAEPQSAGAEHGRTAVGSFDGPTGTV